MELLPLLNEDQYDKAKAQDHAEEVDRLLGFEIDRIEGEIAADESLSPFRSQHSFIPEYWRGLPTRALQTPYIELRIMLEKLNPKVGETVVDLGCGYARMAFVLRAHHPGVRFVGYEILQARLDEAARILGAASSDIQLVHADLSAADCELLPAEYYFLYDFGSRKAIEKTLVDLRDIAKNRTITVIARGRSSRDAIERGHPWLAQVFEPLHFREYSFYFSGPTPLTQAQEG